MGRIALKYGASLIALYLVVFNKNSQAVVKAGASGSSELIKSLQGR